MKCVLGACIQMVGGRMGGCVRRAKSQGVGRCGKGDQADKSRLKNWTEGERPDQATNTAALPLGLGKHTSLILENIGWEVSWAGMCLEWTQNARGRRQNFF
jgi:hypothetical protein